MRTVTLVTLLAASAGWAADLGIDGPKSAPPHKIVELAPVNAPADAAVLWDVTPEELADVREIGGKLYFTGPPGTYRVKLRTIQGRTVTTARAVVVIGDAPPPGPVPPTPPGPTPPGPTPPTPPGPPDPMLATLKAAYDADPAPDKKDKAAKLASLYRTAGGETVANKTAIATADDLLRAMRKASAILLGNDDAVAPIRNAIAAEVRKVLPTDPAAPLTDAHRQAAAALFARVAAALETLAK